MLMQSDVLCWLWVSLWEQLRAVTSWEPLLSEQALGCPVSLHACDAFGIEASLEVAHMV
jgi:hypothetical protein